MAADTVLRNALHRAPAQEALHLLRTPAHADPHDFHLHHREPPAPAAVTVVPSASGEPIALTHRAAPAPALPSRTAAAMAAVPLAPLGAAALAPPAPARAAAAAAAAAAAPAGPYDSATFALLPPHSSAAQHHHHAVTGTPGQQHPGLFAAHPAASGAVAASAAAAESAPAAPRPHAPPTSLTSPFAAVPPPPSALSAAIATPTQPTQRPALLTHALQQQQAPQEPPPPPPAPVWRCELLPHPSLLPEPTRQERALLDRAVSSRPSGTIPAAALPFLTGLAGPGAAPAAPLRASAAGAGPGAARSSQELHLAAGGWAAPQPPTSPHTPPYHDAHPHHALQEHSGSRAAAVAAPGQDHSAAAPIPRLLPDPTVVLGQPHGAHHPQLHWREGERELAGALPPNDSPLAWGGELDSHGLGLRPAHRRFAPLDAPLLPASALGAGWRAPAPRALASAPPPPPPPLRLLSPPPPSATRAPAGLQRLGPFSLTQVRGRGHGVQAHATQALEGVKQGGGAERGGAERVLATQVLGLATALGLVAFAALQALCAVLGLLLAPFSLAWALALRALRLAWRGAVAPLPALAVLWPARLLRSALGALWPRGALSRGAGWVWGLPRRALAAAWGVAVAWLLLPWWWARWAVGARALVGGGGSGGARRDGGQQNTSSSINSNGGGSARCAGCLFCASRRPWMRACECCERCGRCAICEHKSFVTHAGRRRASTAAAWRWRSSRSWSSPAREEECSGGSSGPRARSCRCRTRR